jgi:glycosyl transferase family 25
MIKEIDLYIDQRKVRRIQLPIYYINMDKNPDRNEFMIKQLKKYANKYTRIRGFNGYAIQNLKGDTVDGVSFVVDNNYEMTKGEIGCTMSHLMAIKKSYERGDEMSIILEDDAMIHLSQLFDFNQILKNAPKDWEIIQLFSMNFDKELMSKRPNNNDNKFDYYNYYKQISPFYFNSTVGYIINRDGMKKILNQSYNDGVFYIIPDRYGFPKRGVADFYLYDLTTTYLLHPNAFYANNTEMESTIHTDHTDSHIARSLEIITHYYDKIKY